MNQPSTTVHDTRTHNFRISHIVQSKPNDMKKWHMHTEYELYYLAKGERYYFIDDATYHITPGSLVLIPSGEIHRTACTIPDTSHERILLIFSEEYVRPFLEGVGLPPLATFFRAPVLRLSPAMQKQLTGIFDGIYAELSAKQPNYEIAVKLKFVEILLLISRCSSISGEVSASFVSGSTKHKKVHEATSYIKEHYNEDLSLQSIADQLYVSRGYLSRIFNEVVGMKLTDYISIQRVNRAKWLLHNTDLSITEIAGSCGFESITYFEKIFNRIVKISPTKYRRDGVV